MIVQTQSLLGKHVLLYDTHVLSAVLAAESLARSTGLNLMQEMMARQATSQTSARPSCMAAWMALCLRWRWWLQLQVRGLWGAPTCCTETRAGAGLDVRFILVLGFANIMANALKVGSEEFMSSKTLTEFVHSEKRRMEW
jgi:hypothetical protein